MYVSLLQKQQKKREREKDNVAESIFHNHDEIHKYNPSFPYNHIQALEEDHIYAHEGAFT